MILAHKGRAVGIYGTRDIFISFSSGTRARSRDPLRQIRVESGIEAILHTRNLGRRVTSRNCTEQKRRSIRDSEVIRDSRPRLEQLLLVSGDPESRAVHSSSSWPRYLFLEHGSPVTKSRTLLTNPASVIHARRAIGEASSA